MEHNQTESKGRFRNWSDRIFKMALKAAEAETGREGWRFLGVPTRRALLTEKCWGLVMGLDEETSDILGRMEALQRHISEWEASQYPNTH